MQIENFLSNGNYIVLPTKHKPKVYLNVSDATNAKMGYKLYNPFSWKPRLLKSVSRLLFININSFSKRIFSFSNHNDSKFLRDIENSLGVSLQSSIYISTNKQKLVIQLISNNVIYGYLKFPLNDEGQYRILNEKFGLEKLSDLNLAPKLIHTGQYDGKTYILIENLEGSIGHVDETEWKSILNRYKKRNTFRLSDHPRVIKLRLDLEEKGFLDILKMINEDISSNNSNYLEVYEHGDYAPWNLMKIGNEILPFDYEYFVENGLQFLDEIMYHFRIIVLLKGKKGQEIIDEVRAKMDREDSETLFKIFLAKEVLICHATGENYETELNLLQLLKK